MIDEDLLYEIRVTAASQGLVELPESEGFGIIEAVRKAFVVDDEAKWWWEHLRGETAVVDYGEGDGLAYLQAILTGDDEVVLVPTDDEHPPWPVLVGSPEGVLNTLKELRFFEYFVADRGCKGVLFDTHHNSFVAAGELAGRAKEAGVSVR